MHTLFSPDPAMALPDFRQLFQRPPLFWTRRFAVLSLLCVVITASVSATLLSRNVSERMLWRNGELAQEFLDSLVRMQHGDALFTRPTEPRAFEALFGELARMPGLVHTHVYDTQRRLVWSTNPEAIGRDPGANHELDEALSGQLALESDLLETASFIKPEHAFVSDEARDAIEVYIPVHDAQRRVVGVAELYMQPQRLVASVHEMTRFVWLACAASGLLIYVALVGLVMMADRQIARQHIKISQGRVAFRIGLLARIGGIDTIHLRTLEQRIAVHFGGTQGGGGVDATDPRVGVWRTHKTGVQSAGHLDVVDVAATAGQQPRIFLAGMGRTDVYEGVSAHGPPPRAAGAAPRRCRASRPSRVRAPDGAGRPPPRAARPRPAAGPESARRPG